MIQYSERKRTVLKYTYQGWDITLTSSDELAPWPFEALIEKGNVRYEDPTSYRTPSAAARNAEDRIRHELEG